MRLWEDKSTADDFLLPSGGLSPGSEGKWQGTSQLTSSLNLPSRS
jgi:hypothetical protein